MEVEIDVERLRSALIDYYGSAVFVGSPYAMGDVVAVEDESPAQLIQRALHEGFDLEDFAV